MWLCYACLCLCKKSILLYVPAYIQNGRGFKFVSSLGLSSLRRQHLQIEGNQKFIRQTSLYNRVCGSQHCCQCEAIICCCGGCPVHCQVLSSIPKLYPLEKCGICLPAVATTSVSRLFQTSASQKAQLRRFQRTRGITQSACCLCSCLPWSSISLNLSDYKNFKKMSSNNIRQAARI